MTDEQEPFPATEYPDGPLPNRFNRGTFLGCVGIAGVLALPLMLFLPFETWGLPRWAFLLMQLLAFCAVAGGIGLVARVPSAVRERSNDPLHPLTVRGVPPVVERPARWPNQIGLGAVCALLAVGAVGFAIAAFDTQQEAALPLGMLVTSVSGVLLATYGACIVLGRLQPPAFRWTRAPASASWLPQGGPVLLIGLVMLAWALLTAAEAHLIWGAIGLSLLLIAIVGIAPSFRRLPTGGRHMER